MKLDDLNIHAVGNTIQLAGAIYADGETVYLVPLPDELTDEQREDLEESEGLFYNGHPTSLTVLDMDRADWQRFIRQTDLLETEIMAHADENGNRKLVKALVRKSQRQISQGVSWAVYKRDGYRCRYCGAEGIPMTVDHLVLWEEGGPSIPENLVTACRKCNKVRGNTEYAAWLQHPYYRKVSRGLIMAAAEANEAVLHTLDSIPRMVHKPSKR
jgi:5-methylcytosine-specific restriction endonuclease McrA